MDDLSWDEITAICEEMVRVQEERVFRCAERIVPHVTKDDILQPNDFPELENHPHFRYEEGVLEGLRTVFVGLSVRKRELEVGSES